MGVCGSKIRSRVGGGEGGVDGPMVTSDDHGTRTRLLALLHLVDFIQTLTFVRGLELFCQGIVSDAPRINDRIRREDVLQTRVRSLSSASQGN